MAIFLDLAQPDTRTLNLQLASGDLKLKATLHARDLALHLDGGEGEVRGSRVDAEGLEIRTDHMLVQSASLSGANIVIGWGQAGFRVEADSIASPAIAITMGGASVALRNCAAHGLSVHGAEVAAARTSFDSGNVRVRFGGSKRAPHDESPQPGTKQALFDWHLLDGLRGDLNLDLGVDLTVPVIGRRNATHRFRVPIESGTADYRQLEKDLSTLENALLDFAVRADGTLVLERGIPLLPTRGRGKPILTWHLDADDLDLARQNRIRLAVFPHFEVAGSDEPRPAGASSPIALRSLTLGNLDARLALDTGHAAKATPLRRLAVGALTLQGELSHHPEREPLPGLLRASVEGVHTELAGMPVGDSELSFRNLRLASISNIEAQFVGLAPQALSCELGPLTLEELRLGPNSAYSGNQLR